MQEVGVTIGQREGVWMLRMILLCKSTEEWPCITEKEGEARAARAKMAAEEIMRAMGLIPERAGIHLFTNRPTPEQYQCVVDVLRMHLSGAI